MVISWPQEDKRKRNHGKRSMPYRKSGKLWRLLALTDERIRPSSARKI